LFYLKKNKASALTRKAAIEGIRKSREKDLMPKRSCFKTGNLHRIAVFDHRGPPAWYLGGSQNTIPCKS